MDTVQPGLSQPLDNTNEPTTSSATSIADTMLLEDEPIDAAQLVAAEGGITEYTYFESSVACRRQQRQSFIDGACHVPTYSYPRLNTFLQPTAAQATTFDQAKNALESAIAECSAASSESLAAQLWQNVYVERLKRLSLAKAAQELTSAPRMAEKRPARAKFMQLNRELYGDVDSAIWSGILSAEAQAYTTDPFVDSADVAGLALTNLFTTYATLPPEAELIDPDLSDTFRPFVARRYQHVLAQVPEPSDPARIYNATECASIMSQSLEAGGLHTWRVYVDPSKCNPSTDATTRTIMLPENTKRTAPELKRLILHEQEVHARRAQNGAKWSALPILATGTAGYTRVEEGLGVFLEIMAGKTTHNPAVERARDRYITAGLIEGLDRGYPRDARATYDILWRIIAARWLRSSPRLEQGQSSERIVRAAKRRAYAHVENAFRGTDFGTPGVYYMKLKVYYEGLLQNVAHMRSIASNLDKFDDIFVGKYNHTDSRERSEVFQVLEQPTGAQQFTGALIPNIVTT